jgi:hypothetical protein
MNEKTANKDQVIIYRTRMIDKKGMAIYGYRWRRLATNGRIRSASSEGFTTLRACRKKFEQSLLTPHRIDVIK